MRYARGAKGLGRRAPGVNWRSPTSLRGASQKNAPRCGNPNELGCEKAAEKHKRATNYESVIAAVGSRFESAISVSEKSCKDYTSLTYDISARIVGTVYTVPSLSWGVVARSVSKKIAM
jgi:hypothetical protein